MSNFELSVLFFLQLAVILVVCRLVGRLARLAGQPQVVGEMAAGVLLGPSLFALLPAGAQAAQEWLFPPKSVSMSVLYVAAQVGLALYMFVVGVEFRLDLFRARLRSAASVSLAGMLVPFACGAALAWFIAGDESLFASGVSRLEAMPFLGAALAITAFPMLARIIQERGIAGTHIGTLALAAGSIGDAAAWCVLAVVLASFKASPAIAVWAVAGGTAYVLLARWVVRPLLRPLGDAAERTGDLRSGDLAWVLVLLMLSAWFTDLLGIHAVFGAFVLGTAMPRGRFGAALVAKIEPLTTSLLVPLFFVFSGLNTRIDLVDSWAAWGLAGLVLLIACVAKGAACWAAARAAGETPRDALAIGALMNARGMMELIILNIGLERGLITPQLFSIMVIMAIVTTLMATPLFLLVYSPPDAARETPQAAR